MNTVFVNEDLTIGNLDVRNEFKAKTKKEHPLKYAQGCDGRINQS